LRVYFGTFSFKEESDLQNSRHCIQKDLIYIIDQGKYTISSW